jgi:hypothetical protein
MLFLVSYLTLSWEAVTPVYGSLLQAFIPEFIEYSQNYL